MNAVKGYIFDFGATLDTGGCHWGMMLWHAYQSMGMPVTEQQFREAYVAAERLLGREPLVHPHFTFRQTLSVKVNLEIKHLAGDATTALSLSDAPSLATAIVDKIYSEVQRHIAHSREVLQQLSEPKVLVSNFYGNMATVLREFQFDKLFSRVIESAVVGVRKPDPRIFLLGADALGLTPGEVMVVGDSYEKDIIPAREVGCRTAWLRGEPWDDAPVDGRAADMVITDLRELITTSKNN